MAKKKSIEQYDHKDKERVNNPPVGLVTPETDVEAYLCRLKTIIYPTFGD
ncbi:MAG: hypothetical protein SU899_01215 [Chloroflexota bacterium]|nr:hypothetical protein [Chloroflexota bacterium]